MGRRERSGHLEDQDAVPNIKPLLQIIRFQGKTSVKKKRQRFPGLTPTIQVQLCCHTLSTTWLGNSNPIPFRASELSSTYVGLNLALRIG